MAKIVKKLSSGKLSLNKVEVEWIDSCSEKKSWWEVESAMKGGNHIVVKTMGYLYKKTNKIICLAMHLHFEDNEITQLGDLFYIPKGCITKIIYF